MATSDTFSLLQIAMHALFAALGGIVRELKQPEESRKFLNFIGGALIGMFTGLIVYMICQHYDVGTYWAAAMTGLGGYAGTPLLDLLSKTLKKGVVVKLETPKGKR